MCDPMNATCVMENLTLENTKCYFVYSATERRLFVFFYLALIITAIPSNVFSLFVSLQHIRQKNELGVFLFNLALSDLSITLGLSLWLDFQWRGDWVHGGHACLLSVNFLFTNFYTSDAFLCCIALDRYLAVVHPLKYTFIRNVGTATAISIAIWVFVVCFNAVTITRENTYFESKEFSQCFNIIFPVSENSFWVVIARFVLGFVLPVFLVLFSTWGICKAVKSNQATEEQERKRISKLLTVILLCILICLGPPHAMMLLQTTVNDCKKGAWIHYPFKICMAISSLNCIADPLFYCFITKTGKSNVNQVALFFQVKKRSKNEGVV